MSIERVKFEGAGGEEVEALLAAPEGAEGDGGAEVGGFAIFAHPATGSAETFRRELEELAKRGWVGLALEAPYRRESGRAMQRGLAHPEGERELILRAVEDAQRSVDFLSTRFDPDGARLAFVGRNYGVTVGSVLAGCDHRFGAFVLQGGIPCLTAFWTESRHPVAVKAREGVSKEQLERYRVMLGDLDACCFNAVLARRELLVQVGEEDDWVPRGDVERYYGMTGVAGCVRWYGDGHEMKSEGVLRGMVGFLVGER